MTTLQQAIEAISSIRKNLHLTPKKKKKTKIADELLGTFKGAIPKGQTSTQLIRNLRNSLYDKIK